MSVMHNNYSLTKEVRREGEATCGWVCIQVASKRSKNTSDTVGQPDSESWSELEAGTLNMLVILMEMRIVNRGGNHGCEDPQEIQKGDAIQAPMEWRCIIEITKLRGRERRQ
jgi:hypothetical protein